jgi:hypothetical protein
MRRVGVEVDSGDRARAAGRGVLMALEEEVGAVVVARHGPGKPLLEDEVRVLVRLGLAGLAGGDVRGDHDRLAGSVHLVHRVAVIGDRRGRVLDVRRALRDDKLLKLRRQHRRGRVARRLRVGRRNVGEPGRRGGCDHRIHHCADCRRRADDEQARVVPRSHASHSFGRAGPIAGGPTLGTAREAVGIDSVIVPCEGGREVVVIS